MKKLLFAFIILLFNVVPSLAADSAPPWMVTAAQQSIPRYDKDIPAVVLLDEGTATLNDKGQFIEHGRLVVKLLTKEGIKFAHQNVPYNGDSKVTDFMGWLIQLDGKFRKADKKEIIDSGISDSAYSDERQKIIGFSDAQAGCIVAWEWEVQSIPYMFQDEWYFQNDILPSLMSRYTLTVPTGWEVKGTMVNHASLKPSGSGNSYTWELRDLPPIKKEAAMPDTSSIVPWLAVSYFSPAGQPGANRSIGSWRDFSKWYDDLVQPQVQIDDAIAAKSKELTANQSNRIDKVRAIATWMQKNIQYIDIEIGIGGLRPHPSTSTFRNSYGDCKDKVTLMRALLKASQIDSYYVAVYSGDRHHVLPDIPVSQFNHVIIAIPLEDKLPSTFEHSSLGKLLIFDPTDSITPVGDLPYYLQGSYGLLVKGDEGGLIKLPETEQESNKIERTGVVKIDSNGAIQASINRQMTGQMGQRQRHIYDSLGPEKYRKYIENIISQDVPGVAFKSIKIGQQEAPDKPLYLSYDFQATYYATQMGKLLMFKPTILGRADEANFRKEVREYPVDLEMTEVIEDNLNIEIPAGYKVDELPDPEKVSTDFGQFETSYKIVEGQILFHRRLALKGVRIPKDKYPELSRFFEHVYASDQASVVLTRQ